MTQFRLHRGSLDDSMKTVVQVESMAGLEAYLYDQESHLARGPFNMRKYGYDERIDWDQWIVFDKHGVVGFTDGELK